MALYYIDIPIYTDASLTDWGITDGKLSSQSLWYDMEIAQIDNLEFKAIEMGIQRYCEQQNLLHFRVVYDTISYINNMGGIKSNRCNTISCNIWEFFIKEKLRVSITYIPSSYS